MDDVNKNREVILNSKALYVIKKTIGRVSVALSEKVDHELVACYDLPFYNSVSQQNETNKYVSSNPVPIYIQQSMHDGKLPVDLVEDLIVKKCKWNKEIQDYKRMYTKNPKFDKLSVKNLSDTEEANIPKYLVKFAWKLKKDPDEYFDDLYNWWYTNGNLNVLENEFQRILIHVPDINQRIIDISRIKVGDNVKIGSKIASLTSVDTVYGLKSTFSNNNILLGLRQRNEIHFSIVPIDSEENVSGTQNKIISKIPFTSFDLDKEEIGNFCTTDVKKVVRLWDINMIHNNILYISNTDKIKCFENDSDIVNNWNDIKYLNTNTLAFIDHHNVRLLDKRCCSEEQKNSINFQRTWDKCDKFSFICLSNLYEHMFYVGSYHSVFLTDFRNPKSFVHKWTHLMKSVPFVAETKLLNQHEEVLCFSSQLSNEKMFLLNSSKHSNDPCISLSIPVLSLEKSLNDSQIQGKCLDSYSLINKRIQYCTSGIALLKNCDSIFILFQNSVGDVFKQKVSKSLTDNDRKLSKLKKLCASVNLNAPEEISLVVTSMTSMNHMINSKRMNYKKRKNNPKSKCNEQWKRSINELEEYVDYLAPNILQAWGYTGPTQSEHLIQSSPKQTSISEKVSTWLENINSDEIISQNSVISPHVEEKSNHLRTFIESNNSQNNNSKLDQSRKIVKKKKYVQGF